jgi:EpsI family protein
MPKNKIAMALTLVLLLQGILFYNAYARETVPQNRPLELFSTDFAGWHMTEGTRISKEVEEVLQADDTVSRTYQKDARTFATFFVAYFRSQRAGQSPHSPKNCLPGSGWEPRQEGFIDVPVAGEPQPIKINRYLVARGDNASVVLYWYQSRNRVIASDYSAKIWLVLDSIRYRRSDTALVRVVVPVIQGDQERATRVGVDFVQSMFPLLRAYLPA